MEGIFYAVNFIIGAIVGIFAYRVYVRVKQKESEAK